MFHRRLVPRRVVAAIAVLSLLGAAAPAFAGQKPPSGLKWGVCANPDAAAAGWQCATFKAPRDYANPAAGIVKVAVTRLPAKAARTGALFINYGGPGGDAVATSQAIAADLFGAVNDHFDLVAFDPRGVGETTPAIDCKVNQETQGINSQPFVTPENLDVKALVAKDKAYVQRCLSLNKGILPYTSTASVARDMDGIRAAMGDSKLNYFGFSYGTLLGATYASLFPDNYRAMVLDGPIDPHTYFRNPLQGSREQAAAFERELGRFFQACAFYQSFCQFGGDDPWKAFDALVAAANVMPIPASGDDPRPVNGDDFDAAAIVAMYSKFNWAPFASALAKAQAGDGSDIREIVDFFYGRLPDGTFDPISDRFFAIYGSEATHPRDLQTFLDAGDASWGMFDHFWFNAGYQEISWGLWPVQSNDVFEGPFRISDASPTILEVATTYDPATPFRGAKRLATQLGNVRFLTMVGDGHTAFGGNSPCIDEAVVAQIETLTLPPKGTVCQQEVSFVPPPEATTASVASAHALQDLLRLHVHR